MNSLLLSLPLALCCCVGCATVPAGEITFNPRNGKLSIFSPKDVTIKGLIVEAATNGLPRILVESFTSHSNVDAIQAVAAQNAASAEAIGQSLRTAGELLKALP